MWLRFCFGSFLSKPFKSEKHTCVFKGLKKALFGHVRQSAALKCALPRASCIIGS